MDVPEAKRLCENAELKKMVADQPRGRPHAEGCQQPKVVGLTERRRWVTYVRNAYGSSE